MLQKTLRIRMNGRRGEVGTSRAGKVNNHLKTGES